ncbi:MAG TPA: YceI family protein [bacterium]|jgi:polyisoprenoid-binding protein YceI|nr:YceI family protein [bacterium]
MTRTIRVFLPSLAAGLLMLACAGGHSPAPAGSLHLDAARSTLTATAIKNETKPVAVHFMGVSGWADPVSGTAELEIPLLSLATGDAARDLNVRTLFFEADQSRFATARFTVQKLDADLAGLAGGATVTTRAHGTLSLHGADLALEGPLSLWKDGGTVTATLGAGWSVAITRTSLVAALANLNQHCPQPHRVGNDVALSGTLVFVP